MSARYMQPLRILVQCSFLVFMIWLGINFYRFVNTVSAGVTESIPARPDGIDGFLPISGLLGTAYWVKGGEINSIHPAAVIIFVTVILLSLLLRRSFCSWICPVAVISESAWKGGFRLMRRNLRLPVWLDFILRGIKYLLLVLFVYFIAIAMSLDDLFIFIQSDYHKIADVRLLNFFLHISPLVMGIMLVLVALSVVLQNPFCRYLCPYGALLGLVATLSPLRVTRNTERCVSCGVCSKVCPTYIDVMHKTSVNSPECIACWRCISHCRFNEALSMRAVRRFSVPGFIFAALVVLLFSGGIMIGKLSGHWHSSISLQEYVRLLGK
jgi:polyferredoxin